MKTSELTGAALDWAVATCERLPVARHSTGAVYLIDTPWSDKSRVKWLAEFSPRKHWAQGGPIIEREYIDIEYFPGDCVWQAQACLQDEYCTQYGLTPLIAAMRCYVASKLGDEVEIPEELL